MVSGGAAADRGEGVTPGGPGGGVEDDVGCEVNVREGKEAWEGV